MRASDESKNTAVYASVEALAAELGLGRAVVYRELKAGNIPRIRVGLRRYVIPKAAVAEWLRRAGGSLVESAPIRPVGSELR